MLSVIRNNSLGSTAVPPRWPDKAATNVTSRCCELIRGGLGYFVHSIWRGGADRGPQKSYQTWEASRWLKIAHGNTHST